MLLLFASALLTKRAAAEEPEQTQVQTAAESLFLEGRRLMAAGQFAEACRRFEESGRIEPAIGTTMNLARCYLKLGRTASAWLLYRDTAATARALGQPDREQHARLELAAIEPDLAKLVVEIEAPLLRDPRVEVLLDDARIPQGMLGSELPVDPGEHQLVVRTSHTALWAEHVQISARKSEHVRVPHLDVPPDPAEPPANAGPPRAPGEGAGVARDAPPVRARWLTSRRVASLAFAGAAALGGGYTVFETVRAKSENDRSDPGTCVAGAVCSQAAMNHRQQAFDAARRADVAAGISGACLVSAGILWFLGAPADLPVSAHSSGQSFELSYSRSW